MRARNSFPERRSRKDPNVSKQLFILFHAVFYNAHKLTRKTDKRNVRRNKRVQKASICLKKNTFVNYFINFKINLSILQILFPLGLCNPFFFFLILKLTLLEKKSRLMSFRAPRKHFSFTLKVIKRRCFNTILLQLFCKLDIRHL